MSYDIAIVRSDIPDDLAFDVACDWDKRGSEYWDTLGVKSNPTYNYGRLFTAFHVNPVDDLHGEPAPLVAERIDAALGEIRNHSRSELEREYFLDSSDKVITFGSIPNAVQWLADVRDYCKTHPDYKFVGYCAVETGYDGVSLGTVRTFIPEYAEPSELQHRKLLEETAELAAAGKAWLEDGMEHDGTRRHMIREYCDVVEALGTFAIAYGITGREIRLGMAECEKRFRDGRAGGAKADDENRVIDGLERLPKTLADVQA